MDIVFQPNQMNSVGQPSGSRHQRLYKKCQDGKGSWTCKQHAEKGNLYLFWFGGDSEKVVAVGVVNSTTSREDDNPKSEWHSWYECKYQPLIWLKQPLTLDDIHNDNLLMKWWKGRPYAGRPKTITNKAAGKRLVGIIFKRNPSLKALLKLNELKTATTTKNTLGKELSRINSAAGFESDPKVRKAVETRAMQKVEQYLKGKYHGYKIADVHTNHSYDFECRSHKNTIYVEVKGTKNLGTAITLTKKEVTFAHNNAANMILCVVHSIGVVGKKTPKGVGGKLRIIPNWRPDRSKLKPIAFRYNLGL